MMYRKTRKRLMECTVGEFMSGNEIRGLLFHEMRYWMHNGWIVRKGDRYVLTSKGWRDVNDSDVAE